MIKLTRQEEESLLSLARRTNKNIHRWFSIYNDANEVLSLGNYRCLICNEIISHPWISPEMLEKHGLNHLKEKGLLVFI